MLENFSYNTTIREWFSFKHTENYSKKQYMPVTIKTPYTVDRTSNGVCLPYNQDAQTGVSYHSGYFNSEDPRVLWRFPVERYPSYLYIKSYFTAEAGRLGSFEIFIRDRKTYQGELIMCFNKLYSSVSDSRGKKYNGTFYNFANYDGYWLYRTKLALTSLGNYEGWRTFDLKFTEYPQYNKPCEILIRFPNKTLVHPSTGSTKNPYPRFYLNELYMEF